MVVVTIHVCDNSYQNLFWLQISTLSIKASPFICWSIRYAIAMYLLAFAEWAFLIYHVVTWTSKLLFADSANFVHSCPRLSFYHQHVEQSTDQLPVLWLSTDSASNSVARFDSSRARETKSSDQTPAAEEHEVIQGAPDWGEWSGKVDVSGSSVWGQIPRWEQTAHTG